MKVCLFALSIAILMAGQIVLASEPGFEYTAPGTTEAPVIDGILDDAIWAIAPEARVEHINDDAGTPVDAAYVAIAKAAYDTDNLYVAYRNGDPNPDQVTTTAPGHDQDVWKDDEIEIFIEPALAGTQPYYHIMINAANTTQDSETGGIEGAWEPALESAVQIEADAWVVEIKIPFADLGESSAPVGAQWGWNFNRHIMSGVDMWVAWSTTGAGFHTPERFGVLTFGPTATAVEPVGKLAVSWGSLKK